jgi:hypothetical protein
MRGKSYNLLKRKKDFGSGVWTRTTDLGIMRPSLYHLSYAATQQVPPRSGQKILRREAILCQTQSSFRHFRKRIIRDLWRAWTQDPRLEPKPGGQAEMPFAQARRADRK